MERDNICTGYQGAVLRSECRRAPGLHGHQIPSVSQQRCRVPPWALLTPRASRPYNALKGPRLPPPRAGSVRASRLFFLGKGSSHRVEFNLRLGSREA